MKSESAVMSVEIRGGTEVNLRPLAIQPTALFDENGDMRTTCKAALKNYLQELQVMSDLVFAIKNLQQLSFWIVVQF